MGRFEICGRNRHEMTNMQVHSMHQLGRPKNDKSPLPPEATPTNSVRKTHPTSHTPPQRNEILKNLSLYVLSLMLMMITNKIINGIRSNSMIKGIIRLK